jgi:CheY-like chemotaxis protein
VDRESTPAILIVEDDGLIALDTMEILEKEGYRVLDPVAGGEEAVERCEQFPLPDLILMDVRLAGKISGIEAARRIRGRHPVPVIILTACNDDRTSEKLKDLTPEGYLVKLFSREELLPVISLVLGSHARNNGLKTAGGPSAGF